MALLGRQIVMTIPLQVLVSMDVFSIHRNRKEIICLRLDQGIMEWDDTILLIIFFCKLYCWIYIIYMIQEQLFLGILLDEKSVIHKPIPMPKGLR